VIAEPLLRLADLGVPDTMRSQVGAEQAQRLAATIDAADIFDGDPLPLLWHWAFFTPEVATSRLGPDGHPRIPAGGATDAFPRRMRAGGRVRREGDFVVGRPATRTSRVIRSQRKEGRAGPLLVVRLGHEVHQDGRLVVSEEQDLVYLPPRRRHERTLTPTGDHQPNAQPGGWVERGEIGPVTLFRFSAVTFNSHRIHYDAVYAASAEGYPGVVVHGPLTALLVAQSTAKHVGRPLQTIDFRATSPLFEAVPFTIAGVPDEGGAEVSVIRNDGAVAMTATLA
jgi:3-methylfumaryl-CoA hydratase